MSYDKLSMLMSLSMYSGNVGTRFEKNDIFGSAVLIPIIC